MQPRQETSVLPPPFPGPLSPRTTRQRRRRLRALHVVAGVRCGATLLDRPGAVTDQRPHAASTRLCLTRTLTSFLHEKCVPSTLVLPRSVAHPEWGVFVARWARN